MTYLWKLIDKNQFSGFQKEDTQSAVDNFMEGIDLFYTIAVPPHKNTHIAEESLKACYADQGTVVSLIL